MRVCLVTVAAPVHGLGGMQDHASDLARGLAAAGHEVEVITARHPDGLVEVAGDGVLWRFVDAPGRHMHACWRAASYEAFRRAHAARRFDVVHGEGSSALELVRRGVDRSVPVVTMFHGNYLGLVKAALRRTASGGLLREARHVAGLSRNHFPHGNWRRFRRCEAIVPSCQQLRDTCRSHLLDPRRVHVVPNGVDTTLFRPQPRDEARDRLGLPRGPLVVAAGRLNREKGFGVAIRALASLRDQTVRLVIVGDGEERASLQRLVRETGVGDRVLFTGPQPHVSLAATIAAADAFVFPTQRDEAAPLVLPQAMACGAPVIASALGGIPEVIDRPGENGLLVPPGDVRALARALDAALTDRELAGRLARGARRRVEEEYDLERMVARTVEVYRIAADALGSQDGTRDRLSEPSR